MAFGRKMQPIREYPGNLKYRIQASVVEKCGPSTILEHERQKFFRDLIRILFTDHLTFVTGEGERVRGAEVSQSIENLLEASLHFYKHRRGTLSVSDYVTDVLDIAHHAKIPVALK